MVFCGDPQAERELWCAAAQFGPAYDYDDTCNAVLVETAMNVNTMRRHLRNDAANLKCDAAKPALYSDVASPKIDQLKDVAKKILQTEQRNSSEWKPILLFLLCFALCFGCLKDHCLLHCAARQDGRCSVKECGALF
eukprot:2406065-Rhodomonas_salina.2